MTNRTNFNSVFALGGYLICVAPLIFLYTNSIYYAGHLDYVTPHHIAVALNLNLNPLLLCEDISNEVCKTYHRHPPLHFYLINFVLGFVPTPENYIIVTRVYSVMVSTLYVPILYLYMNKRFNWPQLFTLIISISFYLSTRHIVLYSGIGTFDSYTLPVVMLMLSSLYSRHKIGVGVSLILAFTISWYLYLLGLIVLLVHREKLTDLKLMLIVLVSAIISPLYVLQGIDLNNDVKAAAENIMSTNRNLGIKEILLNFLNIAKNLIPLAPLALIPFISFKNIQLEKKWQTQQIITTLTPVVAMSLWLAIFFKWSIYHNFVFLLIIPTIHILVAEFINITKARNKLQIPIVIICVATFSFQATSILDKSYDMFDTPNNGQHLLEKATK